MISAASSPSPRSYGVETSFARSERVGVRGRIRNHGNGGTRGGSPSPGALCAPTSPRKQGEVSYVRFAVAKNPHAAITAITSEISTL